MQYRRARHNEEWVVDAMWCAHYGHKHDAEEYLFKDVHQWRYFINNLRDATGEDPFLAVAHATAAQRAEAFLKTLGLWEEES